MCCYDPSTDWVSRFFIARGFWELPIAKFIELMSNEFKDALFMDFGSNIGAHGLYVLKLGHKVWAIEPQEQNILKVKIIAELPYDTHINSPCLGHEIFSAFKNLRSVGDDSKCN